MISLQRNHMATCTFHLVLTDPGSMKFALPRKRLTLQPGMSYAIRAQLRQATNTAASAELCYIIVSDRRHLATSTHIFGLVPCTNTLLIIICTLSTKIGRWEAWVQG